MKRLVVAAVALVLTAVCPARAQDDTGAIVGVAVSAASMDSTTALAVSGSAGYQFSRMAALEIEITSIPELKASIPSGPITIASATSVSFSTIAPSLGLQTRAGRAVLFTTNIRAQFPPAGGLSRVTPFFVAGGGVGNVRREADFSLVGPLAGVSGLGLRPITQHVLMSETDLAVTLGGGIDVRLGPHVSLDADLRYVRLFGQDDSNLGRFGAGVRYRF